MKKGKQTEDEYPRKSFDDGVEWMADGADLLGSYGWPFVSAVVRFLAFVVVSAFALFGLSFTDTKEEEANKKPQKHTGKRSTGK